MRDLFDPIEHRDPQAAARRGGRPALRRRFYRNAAITGAAGSHGVALDGKPVHTPAHRLLAAPTPAVAAAIAAEWEAQREVIDPARMPLTRLANSVIDGVAGAEAAVAAEIEKYLASDLLFYRATAPRPLTERQARHWEPVLAWARDELGAGFTLADGVMFVTQPASALGAARAAIPGDPWRLGAMHAVTTITGSALLALALSRGAITADEAWTAAHVHEDWNMEQWGRDELALERRAFRFAEFQAAVTVLDLMEGGRCRRT